MLPQQQPELLWIVTATAASEPAAAAAARRAAEHVLRVVPQRHAWTPGGSSLSCGPCGGGGEQAAGHGGGLLACHWQCWHHWQLLVAVVQNKK